MPRGLPARRTERERGLRVGARHAGERVLGDGKNHGNDRKAERDAGDEGVQSRLVAKDFLQHRRQDQQRKKSDHDRGNTG